MRAKEHEQISDKQRSKNLLKSSLTLWKCAPASRRFWQNNPDVFLNYPPVARCRSTLDSEEYHLDFSVTTGSRQVFVPDDYYKNFDEHYAIPYLYIWSKVGHTQAYPILAVHSHLEFLTPYKCGLFLGTFLKPHPGKEWNVLQRHWCFYQPGSDYIQHNLTYHPESEREKILIKAEKICQRATQNQLLIKTGHLDPEPPF